MVYHVTMCNIPCVTYNVYHVSCSMHRLCNIVSYFAHNQIPCMGAMASCLVFKYNCDPHVVNRLVAPSAESYLSGTRHASLQRRFRPLDLSALFFLADYSFLRYC